MSLLKSGNDNDYQDTVGSKGTPVIIDDKNEKYLNLWKSLYVCLCFFVLFIAFNSTQNLSSEVQRLNDLDNFGYVLLAILYLFIGIGSLVSSAVLKKIGINKCLVVGATGHFCFVFAQILPAWRYDNPYDQMPEEK